MACAPLPPLCIHGSPPDTHHYTRPATALAQAEAQEMQSRVTEGRCSVCMGSTYEEDCVPAVGTGADAHGHEVILCDGCNGEAHLRCLGMTAVPTADWHCAGCAARLAAREKKDSRGGQPFRDIENHRDREGEEALVARAWDRRAWGDGDYEEHPEAFCAYCGMTEMAVCSPLVVGQTRAEHDAALAASKLATAPMFEGKKDAVVRFFVNNEVYSPPAMDVPYLPAAAGEKGRWLLASAAAAVGGLGTEEGTMMVQALVVHQVCALQMFQARMDRAGNALRRRRSVVAARAVALAGTLARLEMRRACGGSLTSRPANPLSPPWPSQVRL